MGHLRVVKYTIGADNELFFTKNAIPEMAIGHIGGTKQAPIPFGIGHLQEDNVAVEYNIPPQTEENGWLTAHSTMLRDIEILASQKGLELAIVPTLEFPMQLLLAEPKAMILGCEPDISIYEEAWAAPDAHTPLRTAGGHIHIGGPAALEQPGNLVAALDIFLGLPSMLYLDVQGKQRYLLYGGLGKCRLKPYGVEYRALSNHWITNTDAIKWAWRGVQNAIKLVESTEGAEARHKITTLFSENKIMSHGKSLIDFYRSEITYASAK